MQEPEAATPEEDGVSKIKDFLAGDLRPSTSVMLDGLCRPLSNKDLESHLRTFGELTHFHVEPTKRFCYATFTTCEQATVCCAAMHGKPYPDVERPPISCMFVSNEEASKGTKSVGSANEPKAATLQLDELFRKTKTVPCLYWLPLTDEEYAAKRKRDMHEKEEREREERLKKEERRERARQDVKRRMDRERQGVRAKRERLTGAPEAGMEKAGEEKEKLVTEEGGDSPRDHRSKPITDARKR